MSDKDKPIDSDIYETVVNLYVYKKAIRHAAYLGITAGTAIMVADKDKIEDPDFIAATAAEIEDKAFRMGGLLRKHIGAGRQPNTYAELERVIEDWMRENILPDLGVDVVPKLKH